MNTTYELNNLKKDSDIFGGKFTKNSPVAEVFSAMVNGESLERFGAKADKAVDYIKALGERAENGDPMAVAELNTLRRFTIENPVMEEIKLLNIFGTYQSVGFDETIEREVYTHVGERSREQASGGDVVFPALTKEVYSVPTFTVSGGYAVDYRRVALGDMSKENEGMAMVRTEIANKAVSKVVDKIYNAINNASGIKYICEEAGLTKTNCDAAIAKVRRFGRPTIVGDFSVLSQFTPWAGYAGSINSKDILNVSEATMNQLAQHGLLANYNGAILSEMPNPYNVYELNDAGTNFKPLMLEGLGFIIPAGAQSPIATYTRGGLTSFTGNNVKNGKIETRFDLEVGCDVAKGQEYRIGLIRDTNLSAL